ncbi:hypothetical protein [Chamaesiphon sp.]|uniref:Npun_F0813 family protein n=1 Tax=Chamaesiphon sp. TaxID=2814140 RepID=UPI003593CBCA
MSIIDAQLVKIEISTLPDDPQSRLSLNYQGQSYDLRQAFASHKLDRAQQLQQSLLVPSSCTTRLNESVPSASPNRYLLVREVDYYSLWELNRLTVELVSSLGDSEADDDRDAVLELQQASIWLFQELWLQWQDLLGEGQLKVFAKELLSVSPQLQTWVDLDRLLMLDPLALDKLGSWSELDFQAFDRQIYHLTQQKLGHQFGTKLTIDIIEAMPDSSRAILLDILEI